MSGAVAFAAGSAAGGVQSTIVATALAATDTNFGIATASIRYNPDGSYDTIQAGDVTPQGDWVDPNTAGSEWEIRASVTAGVNPSGTLNSWLALTSARTWTLTRSVSGQTASTTLTFEFRRAGGGTIEETVIGNTIDVEVL